MKVLAPNGEPIDVPDADVPAAHLSGQVGFAAGSTVPMVAANGQIGHVPAEKAQEAFASGARIATPEELHKAQVHANYGGMVGALEAGAAGLARGATVGISDPLIAAVGGPRARQALADLNEEHPVLSGVTEGVGAIAPLLASGGASAPLEGAEAASGVARAAEVMAAARKIGRTAAITEADAPGILRAAEVMAPWTRAGSTALRGAGALTRGVGEVGGVAERLAANVVGHEATSLGARIAQKAITTGARGAAEGALYGAGSEISEDTLGDHELNGEKLLAAMGHGALLGGAGGALLAGTGEIGSDVLGRLRPKLQGLADDQYIRALNPRAKFTKAIEERFGGPKVIADRIRGEGIVEAGDKLEDSAAKAAKSLESASEELRGVVGQVGADGVPLSDVLDKLKARESELAKDVSSAGAEAAVRGIRERLEGIYTPAVEKQLGAEAVAALMKKSGGDLSPAFMKAEGVTARDGALFQSVRPLAEDVVVPFEEMLKQRRGIEKDLNWFADPAGSRGKKAAGRTIEEALVDSGDRIAKERGGELGEAWKEQYLAAKKRMREVLLINEIADDAMARGGANRVVSPSDYLVGVGGLAGGLAGHGLVGGLHGLAMGAVHHVIRERGNSTAAVLLDKLSAIGGIRRAVVSVDREIDRGIAGLLKPGSRAAVRTRAPAFSEGAAKGEQPYRDHADAVARAVANADHHAQAIADAAAPLAAHAPQIANAFQRAALRTTAMMAQAIPTQHPSTSITPQFDKPRVSDTARAEFDRRRAISHDPIGVTFTEMHAGTLTKGHVDFFKQASPALYEDVVARTRAELATLKAPLSGQQERQVRVLLGLPAADPSITRTMQSTFAASTAPQGPGAAPSKGPRATPTQREHGANAHRLSGLNADEGN